MSDRGAPDSVRSEETKLEYGKRIEREAAEWFARTFPSSRLLLSNYRCKVGEIDLIFEWIEERPGDGLAPLRELVFVEVRARGESSTDVS